MKFRKKPVEIEAWQNDSGRQQPIWLIRAIASGTIIANADHTLTIKTLEGDHLAQSNDWIIRGVQGELYPCKPDIFDATYEAIFAIDLTTPNGARKSDSEAIVRMSIRQCSTCGRPLGD